MSKIDALTDDSLLDLELRIARLEQMMTNAALSLKSIFDYMKDVKEHMDLHHEGLLILSKSIREIGEALDGDA